MWPIAGAVAVAPGGSPDCYQEPTTGPGGSGIVWFTIGREREQVRMGAITPVFTSEAK
jgi:hypothetical protein